MEAVMEPINPTFGPSLYGVELLINPEGAPNGDTAVVDIETDEKGNYVGCGIMCSPICVSYYSTLTPDLIAYLGRINIIGHNVKFDGRQLKSWGVDIKGSQLVQDTMLKSYVCNSTKESHGL